MRRKLIIIITTILCVNFIFSNEISITQKHISNGLPSEVINSILQDKKGFIWIGSEEGICRFDGKRFHVIKLPEKFFENDQQKEVNTLLIDNHNIWLGTNNSVFKYNQITGTISYYVFQYTGLLKNQSKIINSLAKDESGNIYAGTRNGIFILKKGKKVFKLYKNFTHQNKFNNYIINERVVNTLLVDSKDNLWIGTSGNGITKINTLSGNKEFYRHNTTNSTSLSSDYINSIFEDRNGIIWIGTENGLNKYSNGKFTCHTTDNCQISDNGVLSICEDLNNNLWLGTRDGLNIYNKITNKISIIRNNPRLKTTLSNNNIKTLISDVSGNIFAGTMLGINIINRSGIFKLYQNEPDNTKSLSNNILRTIVSDKNSNIWIGTSNNGINYLNKTTDKFSKYKFINNKYENQYNSILCSFIDKKGSVYFGTKRGIIKFNKNSNKFEPFNFDKKNIITGHIYSIFEDRKSNIWISELKKGLTVYNKKTGRTKKYSMWDKKFTISSNNIKTIVEDINGNIWLGTHSKGLIEYSPEKNIFKHFIKWDNEYSIPDNRIYCIFEDSKSNLWIGTRQGLSLYDSKEAGFQKIIKDEFDQSILVLSITEDKNSQLWLGTNKGIYKYNYKKHTITNYDMIDNLQSNVFELNVICKTPDNHIFIGGNNGLNSFTPSAIKLNTFIPNCEISQIDIDYKTININSKIGKEKILDAEVPMLKTINIDNSVKSISINLVSLSYLKNKKNKIAFYIKGLPIKEKIIANNEAIIIKNLEIGEYELLFRASNNDGIWNTNYNKIKIIVRRKQIGYFTILLFLLSFILVGLVSQKLYNFYKKNISGKDIPKKKNKESHIPSNYTEKELSSYATLFIKAMEEDKLFLDNKFSKNDLIAYSKIPYNIFSLVIKDYIKKNFNDFVNEYRVKEVIKRLKSPDSKNYTLIGISEDCGFNSKTSFYRIFKKITKLTPAQYIEKHNHTISE